MNSQYWSHRGLSSPRCFESAATLAGVAWLPRMATAGLPGSRCDIRKTRMLTPNATGIA